MFLLTLTALWTQTGLWGYCVEHDCPIRFIDGLGNRRAAHKSATLYPFPRAERDVPGLAGSGSAPRIARLGILARRDVHYDGARVFRWHAA